ncbi:MAG: hypothetical protein HXX10_28750 [Rhodoplanes sp.]|uniref:hypothetical protein n=1 Tax=Rhodoplanes sp. TaxID=1968906 RepID=UPI0017F2E70B|nr:hypothetical protein [Rhodoplanes sp.]NVO18028.1 hypothetical protein [Rhodoplanes sp.]
MYDDTDAAADGPDDAAVEIARLEDQIERLADTAEGCRKYMLAAKVAIGAGLPILLGSFFGLFGGNAVLFLGALAATIGGIVVLGSNATTHRQTIAAVAAAETRRDALIDGMALRLVSRPGADGGG